MKLYELSNQYLELMELIEESETPELFQDTLEGLQFEIDEKLENMAKMIKNIEGDVPALKSEKERIDNKIKSIDGKVKSIKAYMYSQMKLLQKGDVLPKIKTPLFTFSIQKNPVSLEITDETLIPKDYKISQPDKIDNALIKEKLKEGVEISGATLTQGEGLRIR